MEKMFYSIGEVAAMLQENVSCIRYWTNSFPDLIQAHRSGNGTRKYTPDQIEILKQIQFMVSKEGLTLDGVRIRLKHEDKRPEKVVKAIDSLKNIREMLLEIRNTI